MNLADNTLTTHQSRLTGIVNTWNLEQRAHVRGSEQRRGHAAAMRPQQRFTNIFSFLAAKVKEHTSRSTSRLSQNSLMPCCACLNICKRAQTATLRDMHPTPPKIMYEGRFDNCNKRPQCLCFMSPFQLGHAAHSAATLANLSPWLVSDEPAAGADFTQAGKPPTAPGTSVLAIQ